MAMMSLRVNQGPSLNLSGIFKNAMSDPGTVAQMELAKSRIWNDYYDNLLKQQQTEGARQAAIKTGQEATDLRTLAEKRAAAVAGTEQGLVGAIPLPPNQPVPVELSRIAGPVNGVPVSAPPAIVDQKYYDSQVAGAKAQAGLMPYIAKDATDFATAYNKDRGGNVIAAGLTPGGPAAVTPDQYRLASELYTGAAPTTSTMVTSGDTAPAVNAVREAAGKLPYDVALEQAKANAKAQADLAANPLGSAGEGPAAATLAALNAKEKAGGLTPQEQQLKAQAQAIVAKATSVALPAKSTMQTFNQKTGQWETTGGATPADTGGAGGAFGDLSSLDGVATAVASSVSRKMQDPGYKPTPQEAFDYDAAYAHMYRTPKQSLERDAAGNLNLVSIPPSIPAGALDPSEVYRRAGITPAGGNPAAPVPPPPATAGGDVALGDLTAPVITATGVTDTGAPGAAVAPVSPTTNPALAKAAADPAIAAAAKLDPRSGVLVQKVVSGTGKPPTEVESNARLFLARSLVAAPFLDAMKTEDIPSVLTTFFADPQDTNLASAIIRANLDPSTQIFNTARIAFTTAQLRKESGAAINANEFQGADQQYIPQPGNDQAALGYKTELRHAQLRALLDVAYGSDPEGKAAAAAEIAKQGIDLSPHSERMALPPSASQPATPAATAGPNKLILAPGVPVPPNWDHYTPAAAERYIRNHPPAKAQ